MIERVDTLITGWYVVTMNEHRDIIRNGAVAIRGNTIVAVGKAGDLEARYEATETVGGDRFVVTPGLVNTHIHITGEPLTRGYVPDDTPFEENVFVWLCPLYSVYTAQEERLSAQLASVEMLKTGTTSFLEAGTIRFIDEVLDGLDEVGIRGRIGRWVWDLPPEPDVYKQDTDEAIANLHDTIERCDGAAGGRLGAWSMVVGHTTCSDPLWRGGAGCGRPLRRRTQLPHEPGRPRPERLRRRVRPAPDGPSRPTGCAGGRYGDGTLRPRR